MHSFIFYTSGFNILPTIALLCGAHASINPNRNQTYPKLGTGIFYSFGFPLLNVNTFAGNKFSNFGI